MLAVHNCVDDGVCNRSVEELEDKIVLGMKDLVFRRSSPIVCVVVHLVKALQVKAHLPHSSRLLSRHRALSPHRLD